MLSHYEITLENGHWPLTYKTTELSDAYDCIVNLLQDRCATLGHIKSTLMLALAEITNDNLKTYETYGISVCLRDGEV